MGGKSGGGGGSNQAMDELANIARQLFSETDPIRQALIGRSAGFLGVPTSPSGGKFAPGTGGTTGSSADISKLQAEIAQQEAQLNSLGGDAPPGMAAGLDDLKTQLAGLQAPATQVGGVSDILSGVSGETGIPRLDVTQSPMFGTLKNAIESQYGRARQNIIGSTPAGGGLIESLSGLERGRADALTTGIGGLAQDELARAYGLATGGAQMATSGLSSAAGIQAQLAAANAQRSSAAKSGLGSGAGSLAGAYLFGGPAGALAGGAAGGK